MITSLSDCQSLSPIIRPIRLVTSGKSCRYLETMEPGSWYQFLCDFNWSQAWGDFEYAHGNVVHRSWLGAGTE